MRPQTKCSPPLHNLAHVFVWGVGRFQSSSRIEDWQLGMVLLIALPVSGMATATVVDLSRRVYNLQGVLYIKDRRWGAN